MREGDVMRIAWIGLAFVVCGCGSTPPATPTYLDEARRFRAEASPHIAAARAVGETAGARDAHRSEAIRLLTESRDDYFRWLNRHPEEEHRYDSELSELVDQMVAIKRKRPDVDPLEDAEFAPSCGR